MQLFDRLDLPSLEALRDAFVRIATSGPAARVGLLADEDVWVYAPETIRARRDDLVRQAPAGSDPLAWLRGSLIPGLPVQAAVAGDRLAVMYDHSLVDATVSTAFPRVLIDVARGGAVPTPPAETDKPLAAALRHTFGLRPSRWRALARDVRARRALVHDAGSAAQPDEGTTTIRLEDLPRVLRHEWCLLRREASRDVSRWGAKHGVGGAGAILLLATAALKRVGIEPQPVGTIVVNLRRYLPPGTTTNGNFITGLRVTTGGPAFELGRFAQEVNRALESGRPLFTTALRSMRPPRGGLPTGEAEVSTAAAVAVSHLGVVRDYQALPWQGDAPVSVLSVADRPAPSEISWTVLILHGVVHAFATYRSDVFDPDAIASAAALMAADPVGLLTSEYE
ncbi:hypothetical protein ACTU3I_13145 [Microbacterium sp. RD1]|uniref:hypothetical protein n=1 Tax=Microbacterium sp. RD1 TaxID=3457313 RepID=UPI003FA5C295